MRYTILFIAFLGFHAVNASEHGGCKALGLAAKGDVKIASVGVVDSQAVCWDTELFFNTLESWKRGTTPIVCVFFLPKSQPRQKFIENYRAHFKKLPFCYALLSYAHGHMASENSDEDVFTKGNLTFAFPQHALDFPEQEIVENLLLMGFSILGLNEYTTKLCKLSIADFEQLPVAARSIFFNSLFFKGLEESIIAVHPVKTTIKEFFEFLEQRFSFIEEMRQRHDDGDARKLLDNLETDLKNYIKETKEFIFSLEKNPQKTLVSVILKCIRSESSFLNALKKTRIVFDLRYPAFEAFNCLCFIRELSKKHKNIFFMNYLSFSEAVHAQLAKIGFHVNVIGRKARVGEIQIEPVIALVKEDSDTLLPSDLIKRGNFEKQAVMQQLPLVQQPGITFSQEQLEQFFKTLFTENPIFPRIGALPVITFDPKRTLNFDRHIARCAGKACQREIPRYLAVAFSKEDEPLCSSNCMLWHCLRSMNAHLSGLLIGLQELSAQEQEKLKKYAILSYLRWLTLSPSLIHEDGFFYRLEHKKIGEALEAIGKNAETNGWAEILKDAERFGIKLSDLKVFFKMYEVVKKNYLAELFAKSKAKSYDAMNDFFDTIVLDREARIPGLQKVHRERGNNVFCFGEKTSDTAISSLYFALFQKILDRLGIEDLDCIALLKNEKPLQGTNYTTSISDIMRELGYVDQIDSDSDDERQSEKTEAVSSSGTAEKSKELLSGYSQRSKNRTNLSPSVEDSPELEEEKIPLQSFPPVIEQKKRSDIHVLNAKFAESLPYKITLFRAKQYFEKSEESKEAHRLFKTCQKVTLASRLKLLFGFAEKFLASDSVVIERDRYDALVLKNISERVDPSFAEKLNINHLFPRSVDDFLSSYGIVERDKDLIRVSIPAALQEESGQCAVGFVQYTFIPQKWICIHRCFVHYAAHKDDEKYVSKALRTALYRFLTEKMADHAEYNTVIADLKKILER